MLFTILLSSLSAHADPAMGGSDICAPELRLSTPFGLDEVSVPLDGIIPLVVESSCGGGGEFSIRLHRAVDAALAEEVPTVDEERDANLDTLIRLVPEENLLADTEYAIVLSSDYGESQSSFYTGTELARGMDEGTPSSSIQWLQANETETGSYRIYAEVLVDGVVDPDALSYVEIFNSEDTETEIILLGTMTEGWTGRPNHDSNQAEEICYTVVQTDSLGNQSEPSAVCATPTVYEYVEDEGRFCSAVGASPALFGTVAAMLLGLRRRQG